MSLTTVQKEILQFIRRQLQGNGVAPSTSEICMAFGFKSFGTVARHMKRLEEKGYIKRAGRRNKQGIILRDQCQSASVPLLGSFTGGANLQLSEETAEAVAVPQFYLTAGEHFAVRVAGDALLSEGLKAGDLLVVHKGGRPRDGQTILFTFDGQAWVRRFFRHDAGCELHSIQAQVKPMLSSTLQSRRFQIYGIIVGLFRQYA